jgi:hypothetical protein
MDTMRGPFNEDPDVDLDDDDIAGDVLPMAPGRDERRMQVHAYNHWAGLLGTREYPAISQLNLPGLPEFAPSAVLIDFTGPDGAPMLAHIGTRLAEQAGIDTAPRALSSVPTGTLLSRFTQHYAQIFANQAPIGFEAEFETPTGSKMLYRGILLPFSDNGIAITHILGVINWKEQLDPISSEKLLSEMRGLLEHPVTQVGTLAHPATPPGARTRRWGWTGQDWGDQSWADGPGAGSQHIWPLGEEAAENGDVLWPQAPRNLLDEQLNIARALAQAARGAPPRDHGALYAAIGAAHDLSLAAEDTPDKGLALLASHGLAPKPRAPYLPFVKLVFGAGHDKTRLTEYATALAHARRVGLGKGALPAHLMATPGGLKAIVAVQRIHRRADAPNSATTLPAVLAQALATLPACDWEGLAEDGEIALAVVRRHHGRIEPLGKVAGNPALIERVLRQFLGEQGA